jgi:hypothetical protein
MTRAVGLFASDVERLQQPMRPAQRDCDGVVS